jgi:CysZ protein
MKNLIAGIRDYWRAHCLLFRKGLWTAFLVPGILSVLYFPVSVVVAVAVMTGAADWVHDHWIPASLQGAFTMWILTIFMWLAGIYVGFLLFRNVIMILYSPVLAHLSETAEDRELGNEKQAFDWKGMLHSAGRGTGMSVLSLVMALAALVLGWGLALVPVVGGLVAIAWMAVTQFYLAGLGFCDPPMERRMKSVGQTFSHAWRHRGRTIGHGVGFSVLLLIPVAGWFLAPSYGIVAGTLGVIDTQK